jgi:glycerol kinase
VPRELLPEVRSSSEIYGETAPGLFDARVRIGGIAGDQQAALFGQNCCSRGMAKNTYGTGCFLLMNTGQQPVASRHQLLATVAWKTGEQTDYALAASVPDCGGVYFVPAFAGLGAPHWDQYARGTITGLTRGTTAGHIARAALEGIAFQVADVLEVMQKDSGVAVPELRVDGGASASNLLMQFQADLLRVRVVRPKVAETTAFGAACLAGLAVGFWKDRTEVQQAWQPDRVFKPAKSLDEVAHRRSRWAEALNRAREWEEQTQVKLEGLP